MSEIKYGQIEIENTLLLVCDIQQIFKDKIHNFENLVYNVKNMINVAKILDIKIVVSEQYPKVFGNTIDEIKNILPEHTSIIEKKKFSMVNDSLLELINKEKIKSVILLGIESHICILQTSLELKSLGIDVHIMEEGISSQNKKDKDSALKRMLQSSIFITMFESLTFQLLKTSSHCKFKEIIKIIKEY